MADRIIRGFSRLGIWAAVLAFATYSFFAVLGWVIAGFVRG